MSLQAERLSALIEFCYQSARLRGKPTATISSHGNFSLYENDLSGIPGVRLNSNGLDSSDEIWLSVDRLHESKPPTVTNEWLKPWIAISKSPNEEPTLKSNVDSRVLIDAGTKTDEEDALLPIISPETLVSLEEYPERSKVLALHQEYVKGEWAAWATNEKKRLKAIRLYSQLFTLKQQLEDGIGEAQLELVWGIGIGIWKTEVC